jgi:hypothetical protein
MRIKFMEEVSRRRNGNINSHVLYNNAEMEILKIHNLSVGLLIM